LAGGFQRFFVGRRATEVGAGAVVTLDVGGGERPLAALVVDPAGDIDQGVSLTATEAAFAAYG
jgi:hypothetical protein